MPLLGLILRFWRRVPKNSPHVAPLPAVVVRSAGTLRMSQLEYYQLSSGGLDSNLNQATVISRPTPHLSDQSSEFLKTIYTESIMPGEKIPSAPCFYI
jgi:hypothetical protein